MERAETSAQTRFPVGPTWVKCASDRCTNYWNPGDARSDCRFCSARCRMWAWSNGRRLPPETADDFAELRVLLDDYDHFDDLVGYGLRRRFSALGPITFPEPGRLTKRILLDGSCPMSKEPFWTVTPFGPPRVPEPGKYEVILFFRLPDGGLARQVLPSPVTITRAFPSVRLYDAAFLYDLTGHKWPKGKKRPNPPGAKPRRRRTGTGRTTVRIEPPAPGAAALAHESPAAVAPAPNASESVAAVEERIGGVVAAQLSAFQRSLAASLPSTVVYSAPADGDPAFEARVQKLVDERLAAQLRSVQATRPTTDGRTAELETQLKQARDAVAQRDAELAKRDVAWAEERRQRAVEMAQLEASIQQLKQAVQRLQAGQRQTVPASSTVPPQSGVAQSEVVSAAGMVASSRTTPEHSQQEPPTASYGTLIPTTAAVAADAASSAHPAESVPLNPTKATEPTQPTISPSIPPSLIPHWSSLTGKPRIRDDPRDPKKRNR